MQNRDNEALLVRFYHSFLKPLSLTQSLKCFVTCLPLLILFPLYLIDLIK